jgi:hypothetical protein
MRLTTVRIGEEERACIVTDHGLVLIDTVIRAFDTEWPSEMLTLIASGMLDALNTWYRDEGKRSSSTQLNRQSLMTDGVGSAVSKAEEDMGN